MVGCCEGAEGGVVGVVVRGWEVVGGVVGAGSSYLGCWGYEGRSGWGR